MRKLAVLVVGAIILSGCASEDGEALQALDCPEEYGPEFEAQYNAAREQYVNETGQDIPDADQDCAPDALEEELGTDPHNATDYPSVEDLAEFAGVEAQPAFEVFKGSGTIVASVPTLAVSQGGGTATAGDGATLIYAEYRWNTPAVDLNGGLASPSAGTNAAGAQNYDHVNDGGLPGMPDNPHSLQVASPEVGEWGIAMFANGAAANTAYDYAVTVFYGATEVPDGYTAFS